MRGLTPPTRLNESTDTSRRISHRKGAVSGVGVAGDPTALLPLSKWRAAALNVSQRLVRATTSRHVGDPASSHDGIAQEHST